MKQLKWHILLFLISLGGLFLLFKTGEHGAELVYKFHVNSTLHKPSSISPDSTSQLKPPLE